MRDECEHGSLRRSCELCSRDLEIASLRSERDAAEVERQKAVADLCRWRSAFQACTPGGSEYMSPDAVRTHLTEVRQSASKAKLEAARMCKERDALREALQKISALSVHEAEPLGDVNTDDTGIAFADGAWFGRWEAAMIARSLLSPARKEE